MADRTATVPAGLRVGGADALDTPAGAALLDQSNHWFTKGDKGQLIRIYLDQMTPQHRANVLEHLRGRAEQLQGHRRDVVARLHARGHLDTQAFADELAYIDAMPAEVWLEDQPLVRRLAQLVPREPLPPRGLLARVRRWRR